MGFGKEIKDFISAWQAGDKIAGSGDDRAYKRLRNRVLKQKADQLDDPEYQKLQKDLLRARANRYNRGPRPTDPALAKGRELNNQYRQLLIDRLKNPPAVPGPADDVQPYAPPSYDTQPAPGPQSALDVTQPYAGADTGDVYDDTTEQAAARGGLITRRGYADGGSVDDDGEADGVTDAALSDDGGMAAADNDDLEAQRLDDEDAEDAPDDEGAESALPVASPAPAGASPNAKTVAYSPQAAHDAVVAGLTYAAKTHGHIPDDSKPDTKGVATDDLSARSAGTRKYLSGVGAATHDEMTKVMRAVDPENKLSESERTMAALSTVYEWNLKHNDAAAADRAAASMMQYFRVASDRYKAMSAVAAQHGDLDNAMKMAVRAYANIPDGKDLKLEKTPSGKIQYSFTDNATGKVVSGGLATPEQILEYASKGAMHTFDDVLMASAAGRQELTARQAAADKKAAAEAKSAPKPLKPSDNKAINEAVTNAIADLDPADQEAIKAQLPAIKGTTFQMLAANPGIAPGDALRATREMTQVDPANPTARTFKTVGPVKGGVRFQLSNGAFVNLPDEMIPRIKAMRDKNAAAAQKALDAAKASGKRMGENIDAVKRIFTPPAGPKPTYGNPLQELHDQGRVSGRAIDIGPRAAPVGANPVEARINMARKAAGLPPLPPGFSQRMQ